MTESEYIDALLVLRLIFGSAYIQVMYLGLRSGRQRNFRSHQSTLPLPLT
jgi:hypothetical protein